MKLEATVSSTEPAGRSITEFSREVGISRAAFYKIPDDALPEAVKLGSRHIVTESPTAWLARMKARGGLQFRKAGKASAVA